MSPLPPHSVCWVCKKQYARLAIKSLSGHHSMLHCLRKHTDVQQAFTLCRSLKDAWAIVCDNTAHYAWALRGERIRPAMPGVWRIRFCKVWIVEFVRHVPRKEPVCPSCAPR